MFDGIWACASLLHIKKENTEKALVNILQLLNANGVLYASWKYGNGERVENDKYYSDFNEIQIKEVISKYTDSYTVWTTTDVTRNGIKWINLIAKPH